MKAEMYFKFTELETIKALKYTYDIEIDTADCELNLVDGYFRLSFKYEKDHDKT